MYGPCIVKKKRESSTILLEEKSRMKGCKCTEEDGSKDRIKSIFVREMKYT